MNPRRPLSALATLTLPWILIVLLATLEAKHEQTWDRDEGDPALTPTPGDAPAPSQDQGRPRLAAQGRLVLVILDGLREQALRAHMPAHLALSQGPDGAWMAVNTCSANFTVPCVQTILEGRQSPFAAGLHNFTGKRGGERGFLAQATRQGARVGLISDFTLDTLYGWLATRSVNVERWPGDHLRHNLDAVALAASWLDQGDLDVLVLHLIGTDKVAHRKRPGHAEYAAHFAQVDAALLALYAKLDPTRDHLIVTGDHGHDEHGHHTRQSVMLTRSPTLSPLLRALPPMTLEQPEQTYLMSLAMGTPLRPDYEGRYLGLEAQPPLTAPPEEIAAQALRAFEAIQIQTLRAQLGSRSSTLAELLRAQRAREAKRPWVTFGLWSALLILYGAWALWAASQAPMILGRWRIGSRTGTLLIGVLALTLWGVTRLGSWTLGVEVSAGLTLKMASVMLMVLGLSLWRGDLRAARALAPWMLAPLGLAGVAAAMGPAWAQLFHSRGGFNPMMVAFFGGLLTLGAALSWSSGWRLRRLPEGVATLCLLGLPSGVYSYQIGQNFIRGLILAGAALLLWDASRGAWSRLMRANTARIDQVPDALGRVMARVRARPLAALVLAAALGLTLWQSAGGWEWHAGLARWLKREPLWVAWTLYALMGAAAAALLPSARSRAASVALWTLTPLYSVGVGKLGLPALVSAQAATLSLTALLALTTHQAGDGPPPADQDAREGLWSMAMWLGGCWILVSGFFIGQVEFNFALELLGGLSLERDVALGASALTLLKYGLALWPMALAMVALRPQRWTRVARWALLVAHVKVVALLVQLLIGPLSTQEKLYELAMAELLFTLATLFFLLSGLTLARLALGSSQALDAEG